VHGNTFDRPVFFIGMPRSGTTLIFEAFARHPLLGWPSNYTDKYPRLPWLNAIGPLLRNRWIDVSARKKQYGGASLVNRFVPYPAEAYPFWDHYSGVDFARSYLRATVVDARAAQSLRRAVAAVLRWQNRPRFTAKLTGPSRMQFLLQVFPEARFVQVVRDGRAVTHSLMKVRFWKKLGGTEAPFWDGGPDDLVKTWDREERDPAILAALQWKHIVRETRREGSELGPTRYREIRYEDFVCNPQRWIGELYQFSELSVSHRASAFLARGPHVLNMNDKFRQDFGEAYVQRLTELMQPELDQFGYSD
jgi:hypothetical protein